MRLSVACLALAVTLSLPIVAQAQTEPAKPDGPGANKDRLICKRETPVGTLIATRKMCLTKSQWVERERIGNDVARQMVYDNQGRPSGQ